jgi:glucosyl-3-phosphoglycerate synthase
MPERLYHHSDFSPAELAATRRRSISVCIPARDEGETIGAIVSAVVDNFMLSAGGVDLIDEVVVVDDGSIDQTYDIALGAGAKVVSSPGRGGGKGEAMHIAVQASEGDLIVFLDWDPQRGREGQRAGSPTDHLLAVPGALLDPPAACR